MRYLFLFFTLLLAYTPKNFTQWSTDPNNHLIVGYGEDSHICSDSAGGCYVTYNYETLAYPQKLAVERLDRYGYKPWGTKRQILGELPEQWQAEIIEDGEGGVIVGYEDNEWIPPYYFNSEVRVQRVDSSGNFLWGQTGVRVTTEETSHGTGRLVSDGDGGCVIVWQDYDEHIAINRINRIGERVWGDSGVVLAPTGTSLSIIRASDGSYYVQINSNVYRIRQSGDIVWQDSISLGYIIPDDVGGIVLTGSANWSINGFTLVSQRKDSLGNNLWQEPYVEIADSLDINTTINIKNNNRYIYYSWSGRKNGIDYVSQFQALRLDGTKLFTNASLALSNHSNIGAAKIIPSETNRTIFVWNDATVLSSTIAQNYDTLGNKIWNESGVIVSYPAIAYQTITDCHGGFITQGPIDLFTIIAQQVSKDGILGNVIVPVELTSFTANIINDKVELNWQTATETNNLGFQIERCEKLDARGEKWENSGFVNGNGTTTEPKLYSFVDNLTLNHNHTLYYRLKQMDYDGSYEYSNEIEVSLNTTLKEFVLEQNYPNPFNSTTIIKYQIPIEGRVRINLFNILGEKILTLFEGEREKGTYSLSFSSNELPSGNYFYSLECNSSRVVKKLTILK